MLLPWLSYPVPYPLPTEDEPAVYFPSVGSDVTEEMQYVIPPSLDEGGGVYVMVIGSDVTEETEYRMLPTIQSNDAPPS